MDKRKNYIDKYGKTAIVISLICLCFLVFNSIFINSDALVQISDNKYLAWIVNFLAGCEGVLGDIGSMSKTAVFSERQFWRLITHIYLHAGIFHFLFNMVALMFSGKAIEKKIGFIKSILLFHIIAVIDAIIMCLIFPDSTSVGASGGIFGFIGIISASKLFNNNQIGKILNTGELIYLIIFCILSLVLGFESFLTHFIAFILGLTAGLFYQNYQKISNFLRQYHRKVLPVCFLTYHDFMI